MANKTSEKKKLHKKLWKQNVEKNEQNKYDGKCIEKKRREKRRTSISRKSIYIYRKATPGRQQRSEREPTAGFLFISYDFAFLLSGMLH